MNRSEALELTEQVLEAWNRQDIDEVLACYTDGCIYLDPNTHSPLSGHNAFREYLTKLFEQWKMHWSLREFFLFEDGDGGAFLWHADLTSKSGGQRLEVEGMDLVLVEGTKLSRNEVYFDRVSLFGK